MASTKKAIVRLRAASGAVRRPGPRRMALAAASSIALLGAAACGGGASSESFPSDTIEMIIAYEAGGSTDVSVRQMASVAERTCGTEVIASNQTGAAGAVGFTATANAEPDGHTVGATATELAYLHLLGTSEVGPDDVKGVMRYALNPHVYFVPADSPYKSIEDVIDAAKGGKKINFASSGSGSVYHLAVAGLALEAGVQDQFTNLPFDGGAAAVQATIGGQAELTAVVLSEALAQVEAGRMRPLAVAGEERLDAIPNTPTLAEEGYEWTSASHLGLAVPAETPDAIVTQLNTCFNEAIQSDRFQQAMQKQSLTLDYLPPAKFEKYLADLEKTYGEVVEKTGITAGG